MKRRFLQIFFTFGAFLALGAGPATTLFAQEEIQERELETKAGRLHKNYRFTEAAEIYNRLLKDSTDHFAIGSRLIECRNGGSMLGYALTPACMEKERCSLSNFFLKYSGFEESSWYRMPSSLMSAQTPFSYIHMNKDAKRIVFSYPDEEGVWNLYSSTHLKDTLWSAPEMLNNALVSQGNEVFPYLSADGNRLYFSSNGLYGMGGYDIYMSTWDTSANEWGIPQNLGFPYCSPADDFIYQTTPDNKYALFASNRSTGRDSLCIYKVEHEFVPMRRQISESDALAYNVTSLDGAPDGIFGTRSLGSSMNISLEAPAKPLNLTFTIDKENPQPVIKEFDEFPNYLVYQVHILTLTKAATEKNLKGVSPVFERYTASTKRYTYYTGLFNSYTEAADALKRVKKAGFPSASVVAFNGGKRLNVANALNMEKKGVNYVYKVIIKGYSGAMPAALIKIIQDNTTKDLAKTMVGGKPVYVIGPFAKEGEANKLAESLKAVSEGEISVQRDEKK